jgi:YggT family protein
MDALLYIVNALVTLLVIAFLLRLLLPLVRADLRNPLGEAIFRLTSPLVLPLRKLLPPVRSFDVASLVALLLVQFAGTTIMHLLAGVGLVPEAILLGGLRELLLTVLQFYFFAVLAYALLSWFAGAGYNPAARVLARLVEPLLAPIRRVVPPLGSVDLSALILLIVLQALQRLF